MSQEQAESGQRTVAALASALGHVEGATDKDERGTATLHGRVLVDGEDLGAVTIELRAGGA
jgi:hypothetical protein